MTPQEAHRRARELWARLPTQRIGQQLEPLVVAHVELVRKTIAARPPAETAYCFALNPVVDYDETDDVRYAYGLQVDREQLIAENDPVSVWNASLFNDFLDAVETKPATERQVRAQLNDENVISFDYWLLCEVARRLNDLNAAPADSTPDFVFYHFEQENSVDLQLGLAYSTPLELYQRLADQGLVFPDQAVHGVNWVDFDLEPDYDLGPE